MIRGVYLNARMPAAGVESREDHSPHVYGLGKRFKTDLNRLAASANVLGIRLDRIFEPATLLVQPRKLRVKHPIPKFKPRSFYLLPVSCVKASSSQEASVEKTHDPEAGLDMFVVVEAAAISEEAIRSELEKILGSRTFRSAQSQSRFLRYAVEETIAGRGHMVKEYVIGAEVLGRGESFDPRLDPIVRTQARKLRARLDKYYESEAHGSAEAVVRIEFPKGSYVPTFHRLVHEVAEPARAVETRVVGWEPNSIAGASAPATDPARRRWKFIAIPLAILALASFIFFIVRFGWTMRLPYAGSPSIAVIPFVNLSDNKEDEFLSDGLTDELIESLRQVRGSAGCGADILVPL